MEIQEKSKTAIFEFDIGEKSSIIYNSLLPETGRDIPRSKFNLFVKNDKLFLEIKSDDINSLRAAINSYLRWIECSIKICDSVNG